MIEVFVIIAITLLFIYWYQKDRDLPDGPKGFPILGYYPFLGSNALQTIQRLSKEYPDVMRLNLLGQDFYFLNSLETVKECLEKRGETFSGRPQTEFNLLGRIHGKKGVINAEGETWSFLQKFLVGKLSGLGMGKSDFSWKIHDICDDLIGYLKEERVITNLPLYTTNFTSNVISTLLYGKKYHPNDPKFRELMKCVETIMGTGQDTYFYLTGPLFTILLKSQSKLWKNLLRSIDHIYDLMNERLKDRFESNERIVDENNDILDYILNDLRINNSPLFDKKTILNNFLIMTIAGTDSASSALHFGCFLMAKHPEIQQKVFDEIIDVFGKDHKVMFHEIEKVNYTRAVLSEIQRFSCIVPLGVTHVNKQPVTINNYRFPKRTKFVPNIEIISRDKRYFKDPDVFDPNNFLDNNGNYMSNVAYIPFGTGKRKCLGYKLAEMELFIVFTRLMQEFEWFPPEGEKLEFKIRDALVRYLEPFKIIAKQRK